MFVSSHFSKYYSIYQAIYLLFTPFLLSPMASCHNEAAGPGGAGAKKPVAGEEEEELDAALAAADDADVGRSGRKDEVVFLYRPRPTVVLGNAWVCLSSSSTAFVL